MRKCLVINRVPIGDEGMLRRKHLEQVVAFQTMGFDTYYIAFDNEKCYICHGEEREYVCDSSIHGFTSYIAMFKGAEMACRKYGNFDLAYMRMIPATPQLIRCLRTIRSKCEKIVYEFPTYPYDSERATGKFSVVGTIARTIDKIFRSFLHRYIDLAVVFTDEIDKVFGIPAIVLRNGINVDAYKRRDCTNTALEILCMGKLQEWHGYDRVICGAIEYKRKHGSLPFVIDILGEGTAREALIKQAAAGGLTDSEVKFPGIVVGSDLDAYFDRCRFAFESLGLHRLNLKYSSTLKSREYLARGIPFVYALPIPGIDERFDFCLKVPADESSIDIDAVLKWADTLSADASARMREYAKERFSWEGQFQLLLKKLGMNL